MRGSQLIGMGLVLGLVSTAASALVVPPGAYLPMSTMTEAPWLSLPIETEVDVPFVVRDAQGNVVFSATLAVSVAYNTPFQNPMVRYAIEDPDAVGSRAITEVSFLGNAGLVIDTGRAFASDFFSWPTHVARSEDGDTLTYIWGALPVPPPTGAEFGSHIFFSYSSAMSVNFDGVMVITLNSGEQGVTTGVPVPASPLSCTTDTNGDGVINFTDLNAVLSDFGENCP